jgi:hypothetical protein
VQSPTVFRQSIAWGHSMSTYKDYYKILGIDHDATTTEIKAAFRKKVKQCHPDVNKGSMAKEEFILAREAYDVLTSNLRQEYDDKLKSGTTGDTKPATDKYDEEWMVFVKDKDKYVNMFDLATAQLGVTVTSVGTVMLLSFAAVIFNVGVMVLCLWLFSAMISVVLAVSITSVVGLIFIIICFPLYISDYKNNLKQMRSFSVNLLYRSIKMLRTDQAIKCLAISYVTAIIPILPVFLYAKSKFDEDMFVLTKIVIYLFSPFMVGSVVFAYVLVVQCMNEAYVRLKDDNLIYEKIFKRLRISN